MPTTLPLHSTRLPVITPISSAPEKSAPKTELLEVDHYIVPAFFCPSDFKKGMYSAQFFDTFHQDQSITPEYEAGMQVLNAMEPWQRARLPLFIGASEDYRFLVMQEIRSVLSGSSLDSEILITKRYIVVCAINYGYLSDQALFGGLRINLDGVDLRGLELAGFDLADASLIGTRITFPATTTVEILKAPVYRFSDPELYEPVDREKGLFSKEFYALFSNRNQHATDKQMGLMVLEQMSVYQLAQLPVYESASRAYLTKVIHAIGYVRWSLEEDEETRYIITQVMTANESTHCNETFFKPVDADQALFSDGFYAAFSKKAYGTTSQSFWLSMLRGLNINDRAKLPLFADASRHYHNELSTAIEQVLASDLTDQETLSTKRQIIANASRGKYLDDWDIFRGPLNLTAVDLSDLDLTGLKLWNATLNQTIFKRVDLREIELPTYGDVRANFSGAKLSAANISKLRRYDRGHTVDLSGADLSELDLHNADLRCFNLSGVKLLHTRLDGANLHSVNLEGADLSGASLIETDMRQARLSRARLVVTDLSNAKLDGVVATDVNFAGAVLVNTTLSHSHLTRANLEGARVTDTDLSFARLAYANLLNLIFSRNNTRGLKLFEPQTNHPELINSMRRYEERLRLEKRPNTELQSALNRATETGVFSPLRPVQPQTSAIPVPRHSHSPSRNAGTGMLSWFSNFYATTQRYFRAAFSNVRRLFGFLIDTRSE